MLSNILILKGVTSLNKKQQSEVNGGSGQTCRITVVKEGRKITSDFGGYSSGSSGSQQAQQDCAYAVHLGGDGTRCFYDCEYDGFGN